jgi:hypothetical protein
MEFNRFYRYEQLDIDDDGGVKKDELPKRWSGIGNGSTPIFNIELLKTIATLVILSSSCSGLNTQHTLSQGSTVESYVVGSCLFSSGNHSCR